MALVVATVALLVPAFLGVAMLAACARRDVAEPGCVPWILGAGFVTGVLALTLIMRVEALVGVPFGVASIGAPAIAFALALAWIAHRRGIGARVAVAGAWRTLAARDLPQPARVAWLALVAWIAVRFALLLVEVALRPLYAWDAWSAWATKAKAFFAMRTLVPFVDLAEWANATTPAWFDAAPWQPATLPLLQAWIATAMGAWDDAGVALPWWLFLLALVLVVYGEVRRRGASSLHALVAAWLVATLPLAGTQVALAGYADLPLAAAFALGTLAGVRAIQARSAVDAVAAVAALASLALYKASGWAWIAVALPGLVASALGPAWHRRIGVLVVVAATAIVGVAARFPTLAVGRVNFAYEPAWDAFVTDSLLLANWHLVALGLAFTLVLRRKRLLERDLAPLTLILAAGATWIAMLVAFPAFRIWGADYLGVNRAVLVLVPFAIAWMAIAMLDAPAVAAQPQAPEPTGETGLPPAPAAERA